MGETTAVVIGVDTGGTFTDFFTSSGRVTKVPATPHDPVRSILAGLTELAIEPPCFLAHGTTVATNTVLERKGAGVVLLTTSGFEDILEIRRQNRPSLYDLRGQWPEPLVPGDRRFGVDERLDYLGAVLTPLNPDDLEAVVRALPADVEAFAACLLFSYMNPEHELAVARRLRQLFPQHHVSLSHEIAPQYGEYERTSTTVINAYVAPRMSTYLDGLLKGTTSFGFNSIHVMQSNGGLAEIQTVTRQPVRTILSGPAGGVAGAKWLAHAAGFEDVITFDMGGTSSDVAVVPGEILENDSGEIGSFPILLPMLNIETVGAGGGSIARVDAAGGLHVGPESAGAEPGPASYGTGELPTVTDANLVLGRLSSAGLLAGRMPLDRARAEEVLQLIASSLAITVPQAAQAVISLCVSNMDRAVRRVTLERGFDPRQFVLVAFGGAGPLHAAELAGYLGIQKVLVPPYPGIVAALGLTVPDLIDDHRETVLIPLDEQNLPAIEQAFDRIESGVKRVADELFSEPQLTRYLECRFAGQSFELRIPFVASGDRLRELFRATYTTRYGYLPSASTIEIVHLLVRASRPRCLAPNLMPPWPEGQRAPSERLVGFASSPSLDSLEFIPADVLWRPSLAVGTRLGGPAVLEQFDSTTLLPPGWVATVDHRFNLILEPL